jgi:hypothetical protein
MSIFSKILLLKHRKKISTYLKKERRNKNQQKNYLVAIKKKIRFHGNALTHKNNE